MMCGDSVSSRVMYHGVACDVEVVAVILDTKISARKMIKRRIKKLGFTKVLGQIAFFLFNKILFKLTKDRIKELFVSFELNNSPIPNHLMFSVDSVNSKESIKLLQTLQPEAVVVNGTRIISGEVLSSIKAPFINTHVGITPNYRGVHGGYWALVEGKPEHCGVTVHLVDQGIDTGAVLYQDIIYPGRRDNFNTYPVHQMAKAIPLMRLALRDVLMNQIQPQKYHDASKLWSHPTLFEYLKNRIYEGVR